MPWRSPGRQRRQAPLSSSSSRPPPARESRWWLGGWGRRSTLTTTIVIVEVGGSPSGPSPRTKGVCVGGCVRFVRIFCDCSPTNPHAWGWMLDTPVPWFSNPPHAETPHDHFETVSAAHFVFAFAPGKSVSYLVSWARGTWGGRYETEGDGDDGHDK